MMDQADYVLMMEASIPDEYAAGAEELGLVIQYYHDEDDGVWVLVDDHDVVVAECEDIDGIPYMLDALA